MKIGVAFPDYIIKDKFKKRKNDFYGKSYSFRTYPIILVLCICVLLIFGLLFYLQVIKGVYYRYLADNNRIKTVVMNAPRGIIFDRNGEPLVFNIPGYRKIVNEKTKILDNNEALSLIAKGQANLEIDSLRSYPYNEAVSHVVGYIGQISEDELKSDKYTNHRPGDLIGKTGIEQEYEAELRGINGKSLEEVDSFGKSI